jgi:hypothetical protein
MLFPAPKNDASRPLYTLTDVEVMFSCVGQELALCCPTRVARLSARPFPETFSVWTSIETGARGGPEALISLLRSADIRRLRSLLARYEQAVYRLNDRQVLTGVSQLVHRGTLGLFEREYGRPGSQAAMPATFELPGRPAALGAPSPVPIPTFAPSPQAATLAQLRGTRLAGQPPDILVQDEPQHWIEIELLGDDDRPVPGQRYTVRLPDGALVPGYLDGHGFARLDGLKQPGLCEVCFPDLDREAWQPLASR